MNENVRKIFDILGVEPNERFKIKGNGIFENEFYFDERLCGYLVNNGKVDILSQILNGTYKIIKLPKKKKLRDLTEEDWDKWKEKNCYYNGYYNCDNCSFCHVNCSSSEKENSWVNHKDLYSDKFLDQEIEVEE